MKNPNTTKVVCTECTAVTRFNILTGCIYSHPIPGRAETCGHSGRQIALPTKGEKVLVEPLRYTANPSVYGVLESDGSNSVKTIAGGLPGQGRRR